MIGKSIQELAIGDSGSFAKTITETDVVLFAGISGDMQAVHVNEEEAKNMFFKGRVVHGMFVASFISAALGTSCPGEGSIYLGQELKFIAPVRIGDTITATVEVCEIKLEKNIVKLTTTCTNQKGEKVITGLATIMPPKK